jgi:hypothetical protein
VIQNALRPSQNKNKFIALIKTVMLLDINNFGPFEATVWGTVSEWSVVILTAVTAFFLIRTFKSQKAVQEIQQTQTKMANERYRIEFRPEFQLAPIDVNHREIAGTQHSVVKFKLKLTQNEAIDVDIIKGGGIGLIETITLAKNNYGHHLPLKVVHWNEEYDLFFTIKPNMTLFPTEGCYFFFSLNFKDAIGNPYSELFSVTFKEGFEHFGRGDGKRGIEELSTR